MRASMLYPVLRLLLAVLVLGQDVCACGLGQAGCGGALPARAVEGLASEPHETDCCGRPEDSGTRSGPSRGCACPMPSRAMPSAELVPTVPLDPAPCIAWLAALGTPDASVARAERGRSSGGRPPSISLVKLRVLRI